MRSQKLSAVAGGITVVAVCGSIYLATVSNHTARSSTAAGQVQLQTTSPISTTAETASPKSVPDAFPSIASGTLQELETDGITLATAAPQSTGISAQDAVQAATNSLAFLSTGTVSSVTLGLFTDAKVGPQAGTGSNGAPLVTPKFAGRLAWVVVVQGAKVPELGPIVSTASAPSAEANEQNAGMWVAVDATTGNILEARTIVH